MIKKYMEYRKNRKAVMQTFMKLAAAILPAAEELTALLSDTERIFEMLTYMAELTPGDIRKILIHSSVETMTDNTGGIQKSKDGDNNG